MGSIAAFLEKNFQTKVGQILLTKDFSPSLQQHFKSSRISVGEKITLLNGQGQSWEMESIKEGFKVLNSHSTAKPTPKITLFISPPTTDALSQSIQQSTELGVSAFQFFRSDHCQWPKAKPFTFERIERIAAAACSQCQQAWLPELGTSFYPSFSEALKHAKGSILFADENEYQKKIAIQSQVSALNSYSKHQNEFSIFIGPEGGWSQSERSYAQLQNLQTISLGSLILRVPTACVVALSFFR